MFLLPAPSLIRPRTPSSSVSLECLSPFSLLPVTAFPFRSERRSPSADPRVSAFLSSLDCPSVESADRTGSDPGDGTSIWPYDCDKWFDLNTDVALGFGKCGDLPEWVSEPPEGPFLEVNGDGKDDGTAEFDTGVAGVLSFEREETRPIPPERPPELFISFESWLKRPLPFGFREMGGRTGGFATRFEPPALRGDPP